MWAALSAPPGRLFPVTVSAASQPYRNRSPANRKNQRAPKKDDRENPNQRGAVTNQLSGLDVLWAMQKAADEKKKISRRSKNNQVKEKSESGREKENSGVDYSNFRPLVIKDEWGERLDELEKRLQQMKNL